MEIILKKEVANLGHADERSSTLRQFARELTKRPNLSQTLRLLQPRLQQLQSRLLSRSAKTARFTVL